jgi:hypothetical protein
MTRKIYKSMRVSRETLMRLDRQWRVRQQEEPPGTDTCAISGCPEICDTVRGPNCREEAPQPFGGLRPAWF